MNTSDDGNITRRRRRQHSAEFKAKVVAACRKPGVSIAAVALANGLNANLLRRWVVAEERAPAGEADRDGQCGAGAIERRAAHVHSDRRWRALRSRTAQEITIELRRGATVVKVGWPLAAAADCAAWLRELLR